MAPGISVRHGRSLAYAATVDEAVELMLRLEAGASRCKPAKHGHVAAMAGASAMSAMPGSGCSWRGRGSPGMEAVEPCPASEDSARREAVVEAMASFSEAERSTAPSRREPATLDALLQGERRLRGRLKSWNCDTGFGFLACAEVQGLFKHDIFLHRSEAEAVELEVGNEVSFVLRVRRDGKPQARNVVVEDNGEAMWDRTYMGTLKSYNQEKGFGFISCDETRRAFGRDVFVPQSKLCGLAVGEAVRFRISVDPVRGTLKCRNLEPAFSALAFTNGFAALKGLGQQPRVPAHGVVAEDPWPSWAAEQRRSQEQRDAGQGDCCADATSCDGSTQHPGDATSLDAASMEAASPGVQERFRGSDLEPVTGGTLELEAPVAEPTAAGEADAGSGKASAPGGARLAALVTPEPDAGAGSTAVGGSEWRRYLNEEGVAWWWHEVDGDWFLEASPGPWAKYADPDSGRAYWWRADEEWFWVREPPPTARLGAS